MVSCFLTVLKTVNTAMRQRTSAQRRTTTPAPKENLLCLHESSCDRVVQRILLFDAPFEYELLDPQTPTFSFRCDIGWLV